MFSGGVHYILWNEAWTTAVGGGKTIFIYYKN